MKFYRLEHKDTRVGFYSVPAMDKLLEHLGFPRGANPAHPLLRDDSLLVENLKQRNIQIMWLTTTEHHRFGFSSMEQLRAWFYSDEVLKAATSLGIVVGVYEIPEIIEGNAQCLMDPSYHNEAYRTADLDPSTL